MIPLLADLVFRRVCPSKPLIPRPEAPDGPSPAPHHPENPTGAENSLPGARVPPGGARASPAWAAIESIGAPLLNLLTELAQRRVSALRREEENDEYQD